MLGAPAAQPTQPREVARFPRPARPADAVQPAESIVRASEIRFSTQEVIVGPVPVSLRWRRCWRRVVFRRGRRRELSTGNAPPLGGSPMTARYLGLALTFTALLLGAGCHSSGCSAYGPSCYGQPNVVTSGTVPIVARPGCNTCNSPAPGQITPVVPSFAQ